MRGYPKCQNGEYDGLGVISESSRVRVAALWYVRGCRALRGHGIGCHFTHNLMATVRTLKLTLGAAEAPGGFQAGELPAVYVFMYVFVCVLCMYVHCGG